jgi:hypothetical protein
VSGTGNAKSIIADVVLTGKVLSAIATRVSPILTWISKVLKSVSDEMIDRYESTSPGTAIAVSAGVTVRLGGVTVSVSQEFIIIIMAKPNDNSNKDFFFMKLFLLVLKFALYILKQIYLGFVLFWATNISSAISVVISLEEACILRG